MREFKDKIFDITLGILLILTPIIFVPFNIGRLNGWVAKYQWSLWKFFNVSNVESVQTLFFCLAVLILFLVSMISRQLRPFKDLPMTVFFGLILANVLIHPLGVKVIPYILFGFLLYYLVVEYIKDVRVIAYPLLIVSTLNTIFAVLQLIGIHYPYSDTMRCDGVMFLSSHMALYQAISIPMVYMISPWLIIIPIIGLLLSGSIVPLIAALIGMTFLLRRSNFLSMPMTGIYGAIALYLIFIFNGLIYKFMIRLSVWVSSLDFSFFGHTLGSFKSVLPAIGESPTTYSAYLTIYYYLGVAGYCTLIYYVIDKVIRFRKSKAGKPFECLFASIITLGFCGLTQSFLDFPRLIFTAIVIMAGLSAFLMKGATNGLSEN
jgi:hypothetical protein